MIFVITFDEPFIMYDTYFETCTFEPKITVNFSAALNSKIYKTLLRLKEQFEWQKLRQNFSYI